MPDNKNQSYRWPSIAGSRSTGIDMSKINPMQQRLDRLDALNKHQLRTELNLNDQLARISQNLAAQSITAREQLYLNRQSNIDRMNQLYNSYFERFGNVLNDRALAFLEKQSTISVPILTAIMAGYENARASRAEQELAMLDRRSKMLDAQWETESKLSELQQERAKNDTSVVQSNIAQTAKSYSDYLDRTRDAINQSYGVASTGRGRGTGVAGTGGFGGGGAATYDGGPGIAGAGTATGVRSDNPLFGEIDAAIEDARQQKMDAELSQRTAEFSENGGFFDNPLNLAVLGTAGRNGGILGWAGRRIENAGRTAERGYSFGPELRRARREFARSLRQPLSNFQNLRQYVNTSGANISRRELLRMVTDKPTPAFSNWMAGDYQLRNIFNNAVREMRTQGVTTAATKVGDLVNKQQMASRAGLWSRGVGAVQRGAGGLLRGVASKAAIPLLAADLALNYTDEAYGFLSAAGISAYDKFRDWTSLSTEDERENRQSFGEIFDERRDMSRVAFNRRMNAITGLWGGTTSVGLEIPEVKQVVDRLHELGWREEPGGNETFLLMQMYNEDKDSFYKAYTALDNYGDGHFDPQTGRTLNEVRITPFDYFRRAASKNAYDRTYVSQMNRASKNQQTNEQQMIQDQRDAVAARGLSRYELGVANQLHSLARERGLNTDLEDAFAFAKYYRDITGWRESNNTFGVVGIPTSTGRAEGMYQFKPDTFRYVVDKMLKDDERSGSQLFTEREREILRNVQSPLQLENDEAVGILGAMPLAYLWGQNINLGKYGKGNPNISAIDAALEWMKTYKNLGRERNPVSVSGMMAISRAAHGRFRDTDENRNTIAREISKLQSDFPDLPDNYWDGAFLTDDMVASVFHQNGMPYGGAINLTPADVAAFESQLYEVDKDGKPTGNIRPGALTSEEWIQQNKGNIQPSPQMYNLGDILSGQLEGGDTYSYYSSFPNLRGLNRANFEGLIPEFAGRLGRFSDWYKQNIGSEIYSESAWRDKEDQARLKRQYGKRAAEPGFSWHGSGAAIDLNWQQMLTDTRAAIKNNPELLKTYKAKDAESLLDNVMETYGIHRSLKGDDREQHHVEPKRDETWDKLVNVELLDEHRRTGMLGTQKGNNYMRSRQDNLSLPQLREWTIPTESVYEPPVQSQSVTPRNPWEVGFLGDYVPGMGSSGVVYPETNWQAAKQPQEGFYIDPSLIMR